MDGNRLINTSRQIASKGGYYAWVLDELLDWLHQIAVCQSLGDIDNSLHSITEDVKFFANQIAAENMQLFYQIAIKGKEDIHLAPSLLIGFEMIILRMLAFKPAEAISVSEADFASHFQPDKTEQTVPQNILPVKEEASETIQEERPGACFLKTRGLIR